MARIHRRSAGTWEVVVELGRDPRSGKRERRTFTVRGTKRDAEHAAAAQVAAVAGGAFGDPTRETVEQFLRRWFRDYVEPSLALSTQRRYREVVEFDIIPFVGQLPLQKLRPHHIIALEQQLRVSGNRRTGGGLGPAAVQKVHAVLHRAMAHAVRWQAIAVNPVDGVDRPVIPRTEIRSVTPDQARVLLRALRSERYELPLRVALLCGLRLSELLAVRWSDIDWDHGRLSVRQALDLPAEDGTPRFKETKTHRGERPLSLPTQLLEELRQHRVAPGRVTARGADVDRPRSRLHQRRRGASFGRHAAGSLLSRSGDGRPAPNPLARAAPQHGDAHACVRRAPQARLGTDGPRQRRVHAGDLQPRDAGNARCRCTTSRRRVGYRANRAIDESLSRSGSRLHAGFTHRRIATLPIPTRFASCARSLAQPL